MFETRLEQELAEAGRRIEALLEDRSRVIAAAESSNVDDEHDPEGATIAFEREQLAALIARAETTRQEVQDALDRVADGSFGICAVCDRPIDPARLDARPWASTCVGCVP